MLLSWACSTSDILKNKEGRVQEIIKQPLN